MPETKQDPLDVPMEQVITQGSVGDPAASEPKGGAGPTRAGTPKMAGGHAQETVDPAERLPEEPDAQNDLA